MSAPSPEKKAAQFGNLTANDTKLLLLSILAGGEPKCDYEKLASLAGIKASSAGVMYHKALRKLHKSTEADNGAEPNTPTKPKAIPKPKAAAKTKPAPKSKVPAKRRKKEETPETEPEPEPELDDDDESEHDDEPESAPTPQVYASIPDDTST